MARRWYKDGPDYQTGNEKAGGIVAWHRQGWNVSAWVGDRELDKLLKCPAAARKSDKAYADWSKDAVQQGKALVEGFLSAEA